MCFFSSQGAHSIRACYKPLPEILFSVLLYCASNREQKLLQMFLLLAVCYFMLLINSALSTCSFSHWYAARILAALFLTMVPYNVKYSMCFMHGSKLDLFYNTSINKKTYNV